MRSRLATAYPEGGGDSGHYSFPGKPACCTRDNGEPVSGGGSHSINGGELYQTKNLGKIILFQQLKKRIYMLDLVILSN